MRLPNIYYRLRFALLMGAKAYREWKPVITIGELRDRIDWAVQDALDKVAEPYIATAEQFCSRQGAAPTQGNREAVKVFALALASTPKNSDAAMVLLQAAVHYSPWLAADPYIIRFASQQPPSFIRKWAEYRARLEEVPA